MKKFFVVLAVLAAFWVTAVPANSANLDKTTIAFSFDDGCASLHSVVYPVLKSNGIPATAYVVTGYIGASGYITNAQLLEMAGSGLIEPANHTQHHEHWAKMADKDILAEVVNAQLYFMEYGFLNMGAFTPPFGDPYDDSTYPGLRARMMNILAQTDFISSSRVPWNDTDFFNTVSNFNPMAMNSYQMENPTTYAAAKTMIDLAVTKKAFMIFTIHDVNAGNAAGDLNTSIFNSVVQYVASLKKQGKVDTVTVSQGVAKMKYYMSLP